MLSAEDYDADLAERYGWMNRALPDEELCGVVSSLAHRIAGLPAAGHALVKERVNGIALAPVEEFRRDEIFLASEPVPRFEPLARDEAANALSHGVTRAARAGGVRWRERGGRHAAWRVPKHRRRQVRRRPRCPFRANEGRDRCPVTPALESGAVRVMRG